MPVQVRMKTIQAADREAQRASPETFRVTESGMRCLTIGEYSLEFFQSGEHATNFYVRRSTLQDDISTDYWAGSFHKTLTGAIRYARRASGLVGAA
jgi:hypothetical protein